MLALQSIPCLMPRPRNRMALKSTSVFLCMRMFSLTLLFLAIASAHYSHYQCGTRDIQQADASYEFHFSSESLFRRQNPISFPVTVPVHIHVISDGSNFVTNEMIKKQMIVLQHDFYRKVFHLKLTSVTRITNASWYNVEKGSRQEDDMKKLRKGGPNELNIYIANLTSPQLGWSSFPQDILHIGLQNDGVVISQDTLPQRNGLKPRFSQGKVCLIQRCRQQLTR